MNDPKTRRRLSALALVLLLPLAWALWPDGRYAAAKAAQAALSDPKLTPEQRRQKFGEVRKAMERLAPAQRDALMAEGRKKYTAEVAGYFRLSPAEKAKFLDQRINRATASKGKGAPGAGQGKGGPPGMGQGKGPGAVAGKGPPTGMRGKGRPATTADRDGRRQTRLDGSTPAERAMMSQFFRDLDARRRQRGLPAMSGARG
ncbi:MAG: hypothetical protein ACRC33_19770 [Gemmataceae bacterium]